MNEKSSRRRFLNDLGFGAAGAFVASLLPFGRRSKASEPTPSHLLDETVGEQAMEKSKVLSHEQQWIRDWYREEFGVEPIYGEDGEIIAFEAESNGKMVQYKLDAKDLADELAKVRAEYLETTRTGVSGGGTEATMGTASSPTVVSTPEMEVTSREAVQK